MQHTRAALTSMNELASVELTVTTATLLKAIGLLAIHFPEKFHLEAWRALDRLGLGRDAVERYLATAERSVFYRDPHICTACRYRADDMLWRCPHCHEWNTFVEERIAPAKNGD